ncbi:MAG: response regulator [Geminicoccaceae bacterium]
MLTILIADDHPLFREAMRVALSDLEVPERLTIIEAASAGEATVIVDDQHDLDLLLLDLRMPDMNGLSGLVDIRKRRPGLPIVVVSATDDARIMRDCIAYGAMGFIHKSYDRRSMTKAVREVLDGDIHLPREAAAQPGTPADSADQDRSIAKRIQSLTPQQLRVLRALAKGQPNKIIAHELGLAEKTVKAHITEILRKLNVTNRTQAVLTTSHFFDLGT